MAINKTRCTYCEKRFVSMESHLRTCKVRARALAEMQDEINHGSGPFPINPMPDRDEVEFTDERLPSQRLRLEKRDSPLNLKKEVEPQMEGRPILIRVGNHFLDPKDVAVIRQVKSHKDLFIIKLHSDPNPQFPLWMKEAEVVELLRYFDVREA